MSLNKFIEIRAILSKRERLLSFIIGTVIIITLWIMAVEFKWAPKGILPSPIAVLTSIPELHYQDFLIQNVLYSLELNILGLLEAILIAIPIGFLIGLNSHLKAIFEPYLSALRFVPLTAAVGLFVLAFGIYTNMKVQFLSFAIFIYLVPVIVQRIDETAEVLSQTMSTLGASRWQTIRFLYLPDVFSRVYSDIIVLAAISWTYIVVAEMVNLTGGVGALSFLAARHGRTDKVYVIMIVIVLVGLAQDKLMRLLEPLFFPHLFAGKVGKK